MVSTCRYVLHRTWFLCAFLTFTFSSCTNSTEPVKPAGDINELVRNAGELPAMPQSRSEEEVEKFTETNTENGYQWVSNSRRMRLSNKIDEIVAFNSAYNDALYPGALVQGKDVSEGKLTPIGDFAREPITITMNNSSEKVSNPNKATVEEAIGKLVKKAGPSPAQMQYFREEVHSTEQAFLELGLSVGWLTGSVSTKFQKEKSVQKNSIYLYFKQVYYTVSVNSPSAPADVFAPTVSVDDLRQRIYAGNPPCYISQVQYGRIILAKITSTETIDAMTSAFEAAWTIVGAEGKLESNTIEFDCTVDAIVIGGSSQAAANAITSGSVDDINKLIRDEAVYTPNRPAQPISYTLRYLSDSRPVSLGNTVEYKEQSWKLDPNSVQVFDIYLGAFDIEDDGNTFTDGDFYYTIVLTDGKGDTLKDGQGKDAVIQLPREAAQEVGSGGRVSIEKQFYGVAIRKAAEEQFSISAELWDRYTLGEDVKAGSQGAIFKYPWDAISPDWYRMNLVAQQGSYKTSLVFRIEKK